MTCVALQHGSLKMLRDISRDTVRLVDKVHVQFQCEVCAFKVRPIGECSSCKSKVDPAEHQHQAHMCYNDIVGGADMCAHTVTDVFSIESDDGPGHKQPTGYES